MLSELSAYLKWIKTWGTLPVISWIKAAACYRKGQFNQAEVFYQRGLKKFPKHPAHYCARLDLSYCLFKARKLEEAERHLRYVTTNMPNSREAHVRLARLQLWSGQSLEAAWTMRRALRSIRPDGELVATFILAVIENGGPNYLINEAAEYANTLNEEQKDHFKLRTAMAMLKIFAGEYQGGKEDLLKLVAEAKPCFEAVLALAEVQIREGQIVEARTHLRRALSATSDYPRLLSLLAESYLTQGPTYNAEYASQLATTACQNTNWISPREMHVMAEAYRHLGDKMSALIVASKAKQVGSRLMGTYRDSKSLDQLIETLSVGTQA